LILIFFSDLIQFDLLFGLINLGIQFGNIINWIGIDSELCSSILARLFIGSNLDFDLETMRVHQDKYLLYLASLKDEQDKYLEEITKRSAGYAMLKVLWQHNPQGRDDLVRLSMSDVLSRGQQFCDDEMEKDDRGRPYECFFDSVYKLDDLCLAVRAGWSGFEARYRLTEEGRKFTVAMLEKFGELKPLATTTACRSAAGRPPRREGDRPLRREV
jgi:hypothetical protein